MWDERFAQPGYLFGKAPADFLTRHTAHFAPGLTGLAVADGEGRNSVFMAEHGVETTAMELSPVAIAKAKALADERGVQVTHREADILTWDWEPEAYDLVVGIFIQFMPPVERARVFAGMIRSVKPGGVILLHGYTPKQLEFGTGGPRAVDNLYTEALLREEFAGLELMELTSYEAEIDEGPGHSGMSALIDMVARKPL